MRIDTVIVSPVVTEKTVRMDGKYTFYVHPEATKEDIAKAVESFYRVKVVKVNVINLPEKKRSFGRREIVKRKPRRKAIVTLKEGGKINFNDFK